MTERQYQAQLIRKIKKLFPGCMVLKNDAAYMQGIPDLLVLYRDKWAALEVKASEQARHRPNQKHYVSKMDRMSYASFIYPENEDRVLNEIQRSFRA
nr:MAG TPA: Nuclease [Caudoviricetes sp.]